MNIIYTCDNNFVWIMGISMISLFENNKDSEDIYVFLLGDGISEENKQVLTDIAEKYQRFFSLINVPDLNIPEKLSSNRWPKSAFTRMFASELMPKDIDRALYLDCDTIICENIEDVYKFNMEDYAICGIKDCVSKPYKAKIGISSGKPYVNGGVLLMNLNKLRKKDIRLLMNNFFEEYEHDISYADQDILNGMFKGDFGILPPQYDLMTLVDVYSYKELKRLRHPDNYYSKEEIEESKKKPKIIHYTTCMLNIRPWCEGANHSYSWMFDKYQSMSPWKDKTKAIADFTSKEYKIIRFILKFPTSISYRILGLIHAYLKPYYIIFCSKLNRVYERKFPS